MDVPRAYFYFRYRPRTRNAEPQTLSSNTGRQTRNALPGSAMRVEALRMAPRMKDDWARAGLQKFQDEFCSG